MATAHKRFPAVANALGINGKHHGLRTKFCRKLGEQRGTPQRGRVDGELVGASAQDRTPFVHGSNPAARSQGNRELRGNAPNRCQKRRPVVARRGYIQDDEFVGALAVVAGCQRGRIAGIAQIGRTARL